MVFASVQSLSCLGIDKLEPDFFDVVVIDEFHHATALHRPMPADVFATAAAVAQ